MVENILTGKLINLTRLELFWVNARNYINDLDAAMGTRVSALEGVVGDDTKGLVKDVDTLRNDVDAIPTAISDAIQGLNPDSKPTDAGKFVTGASVDSNGKLVLTYGNADSWTNEIDAAKEYADEKATDAETAAKEYTGEALAKHVDAINNPGETDTTKQSKLHIQAGDREKWNLAASRIETFLTSTETKDAIDNLTEIQKWFTDHEKDYNGLLTNVNNNNTTISSHNDRLAALEGIAIAEESDILGIFTKTQA